MSSQNDKETDAEFVATVRTDHVAMKEWFNKQPASVTSSFGPYPDLWQRALNWSSWKEVRKLYLKDQQTNSGDPIKRKRKSRWGTASNEERKSRWSKMSNNSNVGQPRPSAAPLPLPGLDRLNPDQRRKLAQLQQELRRVNENLENVQIRAAQVDALPRGHRDRSPSPPPIYGPDGKRQNTRSIRWKEKYTNQRQDIMQKLLGLTGSTDVIKTKKTVKVPIPVDEYPNYNFIGLIIGPRGKTQKELEAKTGCKIAIRGRGSVKEGARKLSNDQQEPLHVVISGDDPRAVDAAEAMIQDMLVVLDDEQNVHKQNQLRELAVLNGTLKQDEYCANCGQKGHRAFECPRMLNSRQSQVRCAVCGETSHPTRDCPQARTGATPAAATEDKDYQSFMAEINGERPPPPPASNLPPPPQGHLPPPPVNLPPAPPPQHHQQRQQAPPPQQQQQSYYSNYPQQHQQPPPPPGGYHNQQQQPPPPHHQQQQVQPGQEATAWDPNAYYGSGGGAGFNWWET